MGKKGAEEAGKRGDVCIIVDVLRASSTIIAALAGGIDSIISVSDASKLIPSQITIGENEGVKIPGCTYGNSPIELLNNHHQNQEVYFLSTNGTPCIVSSASANSIVLIGSLLNASAVSKLAIQLAQLHEKNISMILAGYHGQLEDDDLIAASLIYEKHLSDIPVISNIQPIKVHNILDSLLLCRAGKRLLKLNYLEDIKFCSQVDFTSIVPIYDYQTGKIRLYHD